MRASREVRRTVTAMVDFFQCDWCGQAGPDLDECSRHQPPDGWLSVVEFTPANAGAGLRALACVECAARLRPILAKPLLTTSVINYG